MHGCRARLILRARAATQVRTLPRLARRALELAGRRPLLAFFSVRCGLAMSFCFFPCFREATVFVKQLVVKQPRFVKRPSSRAFVPGCSLSYITAKRHRPQEHLRSFANFRLFLQTALGRAGS